MVGVAGRSKGCNTCKKRKIACGLQRPQCAQCIKSNRLCTGYQRQHVFIVNRDLPNGDPHKKCVVKATLATNNGTPDSVSGQGPLVGDGIPRGKQKKGLRKITRPASVSHAPAYRQMLFDCFMRSYVPIDELGPSERRNWLATLAELPNQPPALAAAILAISLSQLGKSSHDPLLGKESLEHYTSGLKELQRALYDPKQMHTDETLAACLLLSMYELLECPAGNKHAYSIHNRGCARLIQLRGPEAHKTGLAHSLFLAIRPQCVYQALDHHEQTFLTDPSWLEEPWLQTPKSPLDRLIDYIAVAPGIFGVTDNFSHMEPVETLTTALKIIEYCWKMDEELQDFYLQLDNSIPGPMYWPVLSTTPNVTDDLDREKGKVFPVAFHFFNLGMAAVLTLYWAHLCMMYHGMTLLYYHVMAVIPVDRKQIYSSSRSDIPPLLKAGIPKCSSDCVCKTFDDPSTPCITTFDTSKLIPLGHRNDFLALGRNVCQSAEYCLQKKMLNMGPGTIAAPLSIVLDTIKPYPHAQREFAWGRAVMEGLEERLPYLKWVKK